jgi:hypothetical protein
MGFSPESYTVMTMVRLYKNQLPKHLYLIRKAIWGILHVENFSQQRPLSSFATQNPLPPAKLGADLKIRKK